MKLLDRFYGSVMFDVFVVLYIYIYIYVDIDLFLDVSFKKMYNWILEVSFLQKCFRKNSAPFLSTLCNQPHLWIDLQLQIITN